MSSFDGHDRENNTVYRVVVNHEEQYSIWTANRQIPPGWSDAGKSGTKAECLAYIEEVWTDMRPLSLKKKMDDAAQKPSAPTRINDSSAQEEKSLLDRLCDDDHPVEISLRSQKSLKLVKDAIDRNYVYIRFSNTRGGTELGVRLDRRACELELGDFNNGTGWIHLEGTLSVDDVNVRCITDIDLATLQGKGHLARIGNSTHD